jgi:vitamin B12 transporter
VGYRRSTDFSLDISHTYNDTEDRATGLPLPRRPKQRTTLVARFAPTKTLDGAAIITAVSDRIDSSGLEMDDYERLDLSVRWAALTWLRPFARIENALDKDYEEVQGFTTPGLTFFLGVTLTRE